jgi:3-dehydroquinate synthetase
MVGAFWQPAAVITDVEVLRSLPAREFRAGLAECIKHGLIASHANDPTLLEWTQSNLPSLLKLDPASLSELVRRNVAIKAAVVAGDEREEAPDAEGGRALLNLGHTFGHVIESLSGVSADNAPAPLLHGECVALGLLAASTVSECLNMASPGTAARVEQVLLAAGLPSSARSLPETDHLIELMKDDKKSMGGALRLVLPSGHAQATVVRNPDARAIATGWERIRAR